MGMEHGSIAGGSPSTTERVERASRTVIHVFGAMVAAGAMFTMLALIPNCTAFFKERQLRAVQAGVRVDLKLISDAEQAFFARHGFYTTDLAFLRINPKMVVYKFGFTEPADASVGSSVDGLDPSRKDTDVIKTRYPDAQIEYSSLTKLETIRFERLASYCPDCTATKTGFKAVAAANLDLDPVLDVWTIDEKGHVTHVSDDRAE